MNNITTEQHQQQPMANRLSVPLCKNNNDMNTKEPNNRHRLQSSSSCYSYISNASSTRTHRRCSIEVGSVLFANDNNSYRGEGPGSTYYEEHATTAMDTYPKRSTTQRTTNNAVYTQAQEMRSPADQQNIVSPSGSSQIRVAVDDNPLAWLASPFSKSSSRKEEEEEVIENSTTQAVVANLIKELSFDFSSPRDANCILPDKKNTITPSSPSNEMGIEEEDVSSYRPVSPPLPPKISRIGMEDPIGNTGEVPVQVMHNRNRARSTSISEMSASYLNEFFNTAEEGVDDYSSSTSSSLTCEENDTDIKNEKKTIECSMPQQLGTTLTPRHHPVSLWNQNRGRSSTMESDISSYISSESSCSSEKEEQEEEQVYIIEDLDLDDDNLLVRQDSGNLSLQDDTYHTVEVDDNIVLRPRLTEENLREWNVICEEEYSNTKQSIVTKDQFIFRTLSCPYKMNTLSSSPRQVTDMEYSDVDSEVEEPHLLAGISQTISPSLFSYTNSVTSDHQDDVSELNMELEFLHSTLESSSSVCLASTYPQAVEDGKHHTTKSTVRHRRFKSEPGQIFCNKKIHALPQVNLTFSGVMPSSLKKKPRHQRGQSLCSLPSSQFYDCPSLHCILEEASNSTTSTDDTPLFDLIGFMKRHLETLSTSQVFESGFVVGLVCGLLIPLIFKYML